jgi:HTH-type transcriptional regulator/antitoxin HigA
MLETKGWSQEQIASLTGRSRATISNIVSGKQGVTAEMAVALAAAFGNSATEWLGWESEYQLSLVDQTEIERRARIYASAPVAEMRKRGWIKDTEDLAELETELGSFFGDDDAEFAMRRSTKSGGLSPAEKAWCSRARQLASALAVERFSSHSLPVLEKKLRHTAAYPGEIRNLPRLFATYGVKFVVIERIAGAKIDGAAFWIGNSPVIAVSARWDRIDSFWFTVAHEFMHIKHSDPGIADVDLLQENDKGVVALVKPDDAIEKRADADAANLLVPQAELESFVRRLSPLYSSVRLVQFANKIKMHPGIIVGQLQHRGELGYRAHRDFLVKVRETITQTALTDGWGHSLSPGVLDGGHSG